MDLTATIDHLKPHPFTSPPGISSLLAVLATRVPTFRPRPLIVFKRCSYISIGLLLSFPSLAQESLVIGTWNLIIDGAVIYIVDLLIYHAQLPTSPLVSWPLGLSPGSTSPFVSIAAIVHRSPLHHSRSRHLRLHAHPHPSKINREALPYHAPGSKPHRYSPNTQAFQECCGSSGFAGATTHCVTGRFSTNRGTGN